MPKAQRWTVTLRRSDGSERTLKPRHVIVATGVSGIPIWPSMPGLNAFAGTVMHSGSYTSGAAWKGRKALVLGTGNSGHDVAQDLCSSGADVTLVQRSPTYIVSIREAQKVYSIYSEGLPFEDCDLLGRVDALSGPAARLPAFDGGDARGRSRAACRAWRRAASA